jgi:hypothetical protein
MRINLKIACLKNLKTQRRVAALANVVENRFSEIVQGWIDPTPEERARIAAVLGVDDTEDLFEVESSDPTLDTRGARR